MKFKILIACEESQEVCKAFRELGHEAYSCDILPCSGGHPEWHIQGDVLEQLDKGWDLMIAHPPCTYLSTAGVRWFNEERYGDKARKRKRLREEAIDFVLKLFNSNITHIALENPRGYLSTMWRKPDQIIQPWQFGDSFNKPTCLWLKNLPKLKHTKIVDKGEMVTHMIKKGKLKTDSKWYYEAFSLPPKERARFRSKTFPGIAQAMAKQWSEYNALIKKYESEGWQGQSTKEGIVFTKPQTNVFQEAVKPKNINTALPYMNYGKSNVSVGNNNSIPLGMENRNNNNSFISGFTNTLPKAQEQKKQIYQKILGKEK